MVKKSTQQRSGSPTKKDLEQFSQAGPAVFYRLDIEGNVFTPVWISQNIFRIMGYEVQECLDDPDWWRRHIHPDDRESAFARVPTILSIDYLVHEYRFQKKDSAYAWMRDELRLERDEAGKPTKAFGAWTDITENRRLEQTIGEAEQRFKNFVETAADWYWEMGPDFRYTFVSERFFETTGVKPEDIIGKTRMEFVGPDLMKKNPEMWKSHEEDLSNHRSIRNFEYAQKDADGQLRHVRVNAVPVFDKNRIFLGYRGAATDITSYKRIEEALRV